MENASQISFMNHPPSRFSIMLEQAINSISSAEERKEITTVANVVSNATWQYWQAWRLPEDNGQEHEWIVFANVMKIAEKEKELSLSEKRIATAFCFIHDTFFIRRIMEEDIRRLRDKGLIQEADKLINANNKLRSNHMEGGAENAKFLLNQLKCPDDLTKSLFSTQEIKRCVNIVEAHDMWKVNPPKPPRTKDRLAVTCLEGDALWPLNPIGVVADLLRAHKDGETTDVTNSLHWRKKLEASNRTILDARPKWEKIGRIPKKDFIGEGIFRTEMGYRLYSNWRDFWGLEKT
jgi:hypothetical protein